MVCNIF